MSKLSNKSQINFSAAEELQKSYHYCSVVHCSYYGCLQLMKHILLYKIGKTEAEIKADLNFSRDTSHSYIITQIIIYLKSLNNGSVTLFSSNMNSLKKLRTNADYADVDIDVDSGKNSILLSQEVNKILQKAL